MNDSPLNIQASVVEGSPSNGFDVQVDTLIVGAGACGLIAALAAHEQGQQVLVVEAESASAGSTALSAGLIPAAGSAVQIKAGITDSAAQFAADIQCKAHQQNDQVLVDALARGSAQVIDWLMDQYQLPFSVVSDFDYPGHSQRRMHGLPTRSGVELINALRSCCERAGIDIICNRRAAIVYREAERVLGVGVRLDDGSSESIACRKLILACNGFGGNRAMVRQYMPDIEQALWFGHDANRGDAIAWGSSMGASLGHLGAYQGHGNVAHPHGILITWAVITEGGVQLNSRGQRFWDESQGYSEAARAVLAQEGSCAVTVFDERIAAVARQFEDFKQAEAVGAVRQFHTLAQLADEFGFPQQALCSTISAIPNGGTDSFGRRFNASPLQAPYFAVRVTGALFHTQGGLRVLGNGQVLREDGQVFPNLFAGGGAVCGVSGTGDSGYLSGNGLLSAVVLGFYAGRAALS